jgi:hypothetical protein
MVEKEVDKLKAGSWTFVLCVHFFSGISTEFSRSYILEIITILFYFYFFVYLCSLQPTTLATRSMA